MGEQRQKPSRKREGFSVYSLGEKYILTQEGSAGGRTKKLSGVAFFMLAGADMINVVEFKCCLWTPQEAKGGSFFNQRIGSDE